ncbi:hypothetical protein O0L34_g11252 [Tuta absoluta]|nr:hypothetical protein O0L34_g2180 [Tuta absoluta]KAJ2949930.1 hypothetical protein O0L34_g11252 [Tuta absoluta]
MAQSQFSLSWSAHRSNICTGLSSLQQNGEFVDMTLAADGHHVKVHQVIMALASPYIKDLMSSAQCPHPVIFLNKISYSTLSAILEYIYTGEVLVPVESLSELVEAGKELHIKGLEDMNFDQSSTSFMSRPARPPPPQIIFEKEDVKDQDLDECCFFEVSDKDGEKYMMYGNPSSNIQDADITEAIEDETLDEEILDEHTFDETIQQEEEDMQTDISQDISSQNIIIQKSVGKDSFEGKIKTEPTSVAITSNELIAKAGKKIDCGALQYTISTQGSLQLILNRFVYYLKHTKRCGTRQWRCVDYLAQCRCPALVVTNDNVVTNRIGQHMHPFHDRRILKKVKSGAVFTAIHQAIEEGHTKKNTKDTAARKATEYTKGQTSE